MTTEEKRIDEEKSSQLDRPEPIPGFPEFGHIPFEGLHNTRDLGGMPTADGRTIAPAKLLRSGALHKASRIWRGSWATTTSPASSTSAPSSSATRSPTLASLWKAWSSTTSRR